MPEGVWKIFVSLGVPGLVLGKQLGNPAKAAQAIIQVVESPHPPMRLALGTMP